MLRRFLPAIKRYPQEIQKPADPFELMESLWRDVFDLGLKESYFPAINMSENEKEIKIEAEMPGMEPKDIELTIQNNTLIIKGEKRFQEEQSRDNYHRIECSYGSFYRTIPLPAEVEESQISAKFKNGILEIKLPKKDGAKGRKIPIEG